MSAAAAIVVMDQQRRVRNQPPPPRGPFDNVSIVPKGTAVSFEGGVDAGVQQAERARLGDLIAVLRDPRDPRGTLRLQEIGLSDPDKKFPYLHALGRPAAGTDRGHRPRWDFELRDTVRAVVDLREPAYGQRSPSTHVRRFHRTAEARFSAGQSLRNTGPGAKVVSTADRLPLRQAALGALGLAFAGGIVTLGEAVG